MHKHWKNPFIARLLAAVLPLLFIVPLGAGIVQNAYYQRMTTGDFQAISEFFTSQESHQAGRVVVRTDPAQRDGLYFILELSRPNAIGSVRLEWIPTDQKEARTQVFTLPAGASAREVLLGLTGEQAPASGIRPLAWRIEVLGVDGRLIDSHESFLWRMP